MVPKGINLNTESLNTECFLRFKKDTFLKFGLTLKRSFSEIINANSDQHKSTKNKQNYHTKKLTIKSKRKGQICSINGNIRRN